MIYMAVGMLMVGLSLGLFAGFKAGEWATDQEWKERLHRMARLLREEEGQR